MSLESKLRECADELPTGDDRTAYLLREAAKAIEAQRSALGSARVVDIPGLPGETPRTDAECAVQDECGAATRTMIRSDFARQLERELQVSRRQLEQWVCDHQKDTDAAWQRARQAERQAREAYDLIEAKDVELAGVRSGGASNGRVPESPEAAIRGAWEDGECPQQRGEAILARTQEERDDNDLLRAAGDLAVHQGAWDGMVPLGGMPKAAFTAMLREVDRKLESAPVVPMQPEIAIQETRCPACDCKETEIHFDGTTLFLHCLGCLSDTSGWPLIDANAALAGRAPKKDIPTDTARLDSLEAMLKACPHARVTFNDDVDREDDDGDVPMGYSIRIDGCDPLTVNAPTLREALDIVNAAPIDESSAPKERKHGSHGTTGGPEGEGP